MELSYNGINFKLLTLDKVDRKLVYSADGTTVVWVEWNILASCVYAPSITSGSPDYADTDLGGTSVTTTKLNEHAEAVPYPLASTGGTESPQVGNNPRPPTIYQSPSTVGPIASDQEILRRIAVPRKQLRIFTPFATWLESPRSGFDRDCNNGPIVKAAPVVSAMGHGATFGVQLEITTWVPASEEDRLVLSHRWQMTMDRNDANYLARTVTGEVVFHSGMLKKQKLNASWLMSQFLHPIPSGFRRHLGPITLSPNGNTLRYSYQDEDQTVVFSPGNSGCTEVEVVVNTGISVPLARDLLEI